MKNIFPWIVMIAGAGLAGFGLYRQSQNKDLTTDGKIQEVKNLVFVIGGLILVGIAGVTFDLKSKMGE